MSVRSTLDCGPADAGLPLVQGSPVAAGVSWTYKAEPLPRGRWFSALKKVFWPARQQAGLQKRQRAAAVQGAAALLLLAGSAFAQTGTGLTGKYYDATDFVTAVTTRTDASLNFDFGTAIPSGTAITAPTTYSIAWSGQIEAAYSELYTFFVTADDGARLWIDDELIVQRTFAQGTGEMRGQRRMKAGHRVNVRLEFIQQTGSASVKLEWAAPSQIKQVVPTNRLYTTTEIPNGGSVMREVWHGLAGASISTMTSNANYPNKPASREFLTSFECLAQSWEDSFGTRVTGFIRAPVSGSYTFAVSGDEVVQLYLSTDATAANKALIASTTTATAFRDFAANASQQSTPRTLVAGQRYYVELLHKEDTGADHWSVAWKQPGDATFSIIPGTVLMMPGTEQANPSTTSYFNTLATEQPRLGVTRERFTWLKQAYLSATSSNAKTRAQSIVNSANSDLTAAFDGGRADRDRIERMATAWWLTGNAAYPARVMQIMTNAQANGDHTVKWKGLTISLTALGYDWLYPAWTAAERTTLTNYLVTQGLNSQSNSYGNNIGMINDGGYIMASLSVGMVNEGAAEPDLSQGVSQLAGKVNQYNANAGAWLEGTDYGIFAKWGFAPAMESLETALGSSFALGRTAGLFMARREPLHIASNTRQRFTFSDIGTGSHNAVGWANWWARRFDALEVYDFSRQVGTSPRSALVLPETTLSPASVGLNPDQAYRGPADASPVVFQEVATLRQNWTDTKATFVGGMGGTYMSHGMLQSGTFQMSARGVKWFVDLSSESYDVPNHNGTTPVSGADRWDYYRNRAEGHNCLIVNPTSQPDRIWNAASAPMIAYQSAQNGQRSFAIWDLTNNITGVTKVQRGIQLLGQRKEVLIQDEIVHPTPTTCWWFAHFPNSSISATISGDGSSVTLQNGTERLWGKIVSGGGVWTVRAALPLPTSPAPAENANNSSFSKLSIQLTNVTNSTLAVWFVPLAPGEVAPTTTPTITPLNTWSLVSQNEAPVAQNSGANSIGGAPVDVDLRTLVTDDWTPTTQLTFAASGAIGGTVAIQPDGFTARFTPTPAFVGAQSFTFTATDADGASSNSASIIIGASPVITNWTSAASGNWSTAANWQGNVAPVSGHGADIQFFNGQTLAATTITATNDLDGTTEANKLNFSGTGTATTVVNVSGNPLRLVRNGATSPTISLTGVTAGYRYNIANDIALDDNVTINASNSGTFVFNGAISGSGGITRTSTFSSLILAGNNSYAGPTTISAGTLQIGNDGASGTLGGGAVSVASGATLRIDRTGIVEVPNDISGAGALLISGPAQTDVVSLTGNNTFTGTVSIASGSLRITDAAQLGEGAKSITATSATSALRLDGSAGPVVLPAQFALSTSNPNGAIINEAGDNEIGSGVTLTGGAGGTRITSLAGTLTIQGNVAPNFTGRSLDLRGAGNGVINGHVLDGSTTNTLGTVSKNDAGTWTLNGNNSFTGATTVSAGRLTINGTHTTSTVTVAAGATLSGRGSITAPITVNGTLAPGDGFGTMQSSSTLSFASTSKLQWELGSNSLAGDQIVSTGAITATAGAKIDVVLNSPGSETTYLLSFWRSARIWPVITGASLSGTFTLGTVSGDAAGHATATYGAFSLQHTATGVNLVWTPIPGFPIIDEPIVTFTQPTANPAALPNVESRLRIAATASGGGTISYAWSVVAGEGGSTGTVNFANAYAADTTALFSEAGTYTLRCTATNEAVSRYADITVLVAPATTLVLQEDLDGYSHRASYLMGNSTAWNHGADPQLRVGRNSSAGQRTVLGFPLDGLPAGSVIRSAKLDVWTDATTGVGTVGMLELRKLTRSFVEGIGNGSASSHGAGSGVTWLNYNATSPWTMAGGDFESSALGTVAGFDATMPSTQKTFVSTLPLVAAAQAALDADSALELILLSPSTEADTAANNYTNLKSNDHAEAAQRPRLTLDFTFNSLPTIDPGSVSDAGVGFPLSLNGVVTFATSSTWSFVSGPGTATFANAASPTTSVIFSATGSYVLRLTAVNALGEASRDLAVTVASVPSGFAAWQAANWPSVTDVLIIGPNADPDGDGVTNAIEFNAGTNPTSAASLPSFVWNRMVSGSWSNAGSWNHGVAPASNAATKIEFFTALNPSGSIAANNDIGGGMTLQSLTLNGVGSGSASISGGAINFASGGAMSLNSEGIGYAISAPVTFNALTSIGGTSLDALTLSGAISGAGGFTKSGAYDLIVSGGLGGSGLVVANEGRVRITGPVTSTGNIQVSGGTLEFASNTSGVKQIVFGATPGLVEVNANVTATGITAQTNSSTANVLSIGAGKTLTLSGASTLGASSGTMNLDVIGASGTLAISGNTNFYVGGGGTATGTLDMSGLGTFTANLGTGTFNIGNGSTNGTSGAPWTVILPATSTLAATKVSVGGGFGNTTNASAYTLKLGSGTNVINTTDLYIGTYNNQGRGNVNTALSFDTSTGTLTLRGLAGGTSRANVHVGENNGGSTGTNSGGKFDLSGSASTTLAGGNADLMIGTLNISQRSGGNSDTSSMTFRSGSMDINTLVVGKAGGTTASGTLTLNGGTVIINTAATIAQGTGGTTNGTFTIAGANVTSTPGLVLGNQSGTGVVNATLNLTSGSLTLGGDLSSLGTVTNTLNLNGGTLDLGGNDIVSVTTLTFSSGTLKNVATINSTAGITKTGTGTLTLEGTMGYTGVTTISAGTLRVGAASGTNTTTSLSTSSSIVNDATLIFRRTDGADVDIANAISGTGSVSYEGNGTTNQSRYTVNNASTYSGGTTISSSRVNLTNATGLGTGNVVVNSGASVFFNGAGTVANTFSIAGNGWSEGAGQLGALRLASGTVLTGDITLAANSRVTVNTGATATISGAISGAFALEIGEDSATGTLTLNGTHSYSGSTTITFGTLNLGGTLASNLINNATLAPQSAPSTSGSLTNNGTYRVRLNAGSNDRLSVGSTVTLGGTLDLVPAVGLSVGTTFAILTKTSPGAITGTFTGRAQNSTWTEDGYLWQISYTGGDGNDVVVTITTPPPFDTWLTTYPTLTGNNALPTADPDNDGVQNLLEYATAMNPTLNDAVPMSALKNGNTLEFIYTKNKAATDVTYIVEWSDDLVTWSTVGVTSSVFTDGTTTQQIKALVPAGVAKRFVHLKVTKP